MYLCICMLLLPLLLLPLCQAERFQQGLKRFQQVCFKHSRGDLYAGWLALKGFPQQLIPICSCAHITVTMNCYLYSLVLLLCRHTAVTSPCCPHFARLDKSSSSDLLLQNSYWVPVVITAFPPWTASSWAHLSFPSETHSSFKASPFQMAISVLKRHLDHSLNNML